MATLRDEKSLRGAILKAAECARECRFQAAGATDPARGRERSEKALAFEDAAARLSCLLDNLLGAAHA